jgi:glycerophosphoryl diester phosphodiesterase
VPILMHDDTLERTTDGRGPVAAATFERIARLDAGARFGVAFAGEPVPTLAAALELLVALGMAANVEIKPCKGREAETGAAVARTLLDHWPRHGPPVLVSSFARAALTTARATAPGLPLGLLVTRIPRAWATTLQAFGCTTLHPWYLPARLATVRSLARAGVPLLLYTVNQPTRAHRLLNAGARAIITDAPERIMPVASRFARPAQ